MIVNTRKQSYYVNNEDLSMIEAGSTIFDIETNKFYMFLAPGVLTELDAEELPTVNTLEELIEAIALGGEINIVENIDASNAFVITADTTITNEGIITISKDTVGDGVFKATSGTLTLNGKGAINGLGENPYSMAIWATDNGKVIINDGYFTNVGAKSETDGEHFDLIYASVNGQVEINGGEFKCETPKWTLNIKDANRDTASIVVKGGKFHGFDPSNCLTEGEGTNFVAEGYKVVETDGIFEVIPE